MTTDPLLNLALRRALRAATFYLYARGFEALSVANEKMTVTTLVNVGSRLASADLVKPLNDEQEKA